MQMDDVNELLSDVLDHDPTDVDFHFEVDGVLARWGVRSVSIREAIGESYRGIVEAVVDGDEPELASLLGKKVTLRIERGPELVVQRAHEGTASR